MLYSFIDFAIVFSLHPRWCHGDARDELRMLGALEADPECISRLHFVNFQSGRLGFPLLAAVIAEHTRCARILAQAEVASERRGNTGIIFNTTIFK